LAKIPKIEWRKIVIFPMYFSPPPWEASRNENFLVKKIFEQASKQANTCKYTIGSRRWDIDSYIGKLPLCTLLCGGTKIYTHKAQLCTIFGLSFVECGLLFVGNDKFHSSGFVMAT
jgi:hypothetical protein